MSNVGCWDPRDQVQEVSCGITFRPVFMVLDFAPRRFAQLRVNESKNCFLVLLDLLSFKLPFLPVVCVIS